MTGVADAGATLIGSRAMPGGHAVGGGIDSALLPGGAMRPFDAETDGCDFATARYLMPALRRASLLV